MNDPLDRSRYCNWGLPMQAITAALESPGACALPFLRDHWRERLLAEARCYPYRPARKEVGRDSALVQQRMDVEPNIRPNSLFEVLVRDFQAAFNASLVATNPFVETVDFNDLMLQRYTVGEIGITPHRDRTDYRNIVVLFVLSGRGRFGISRTRDDQQPQEIANGPGDIILMRAPGFIGNNTKELERPYHFVHDITEPRYIFGLRDDITKRDAI